MKENFSSNFSFASKEKSSKWRGNELIRCKVPNKVIRHNILHQIYFNKLLSHLYLNNKIVQIFYHDLCASFLKCIEILSEFPHTFDAEEKQIFSLPLPKVLLDKQKNIVTTHSFLFSKHLLKHFLIVRGHNNTFLYFTIQLLFGMWHIFWSNSASSN